MSIVNATAATYLYGRSVYVAAELYTIVTTAGTLALTTWHATLLSALPAVIKRGPFRLSLAGDASSCDVQIAQGGLTLGGHTLIQAAVQGHFDAGTLLVERVLDPGATNIRVARFRGWIETVEPDGTMLRIVAKDYMTKVDRPFPARNMQPQCPYRYGSPPCGDTGASCDKKLATCVTNANTAKFGGFPNVVPPQGPDW
jgi:hypothetical protein